MWEVLLSRKTTTVGVSLVAVAGAAILVSVSHTAGYTLFGLAFVWLLCASIYSRRNKQRLESKPPVGLEVKGNLIINITVEVKSEDIDGRGLIKKGGRTVIMDTSADAGTEYEKD